MPRVKTSSAAKKRFVKKGNGKIKVGRASRRHLLTRKTAKRKRQLRRALYVHRSQIKTISSLLAS